jgi:hypothetical protein
VPPIVVEPEVLSGAGESIDAVGEELAAALSTLSAGLPNGAMAGHDKAGLAFGQAYQQAGQALLDAGAASVNAGRQVGFGVQMSATNYSRADASSTIGGGASALPNPTPPGRFDTPTVPSPFRGGVMEPFLWSMVQSFVGDVWPNGDPAQLRAAAGAWQTFSTTLTGISGQLAGPSAAISSQQIPEGGAMTSAVSEFGQSISEIAGECGKLAMQLLEFASDVESAQNAVRDLLSRLSPSGLLDGLKAVFTGDALEELREIAEEIKAVLNNLKRQADARQQALRDITQILDSAVVSLQENARREFTQYLGEDVGDAVATAFDVQTNLGEGFLKGGVGALEDVQQLNPLRFAYDPEGAKETWGGMLETSFNSSLVGHVLDPDKAAGTQKEMLKGLVHAEDWTRDRPGLGLGQNVFDVGSVFIGGAGAARTGTRAAGEAADAAEDVEDVAQRVRALGVVDNAITDTTSIAGRAGAIADNLDDVGDTIPTSATPHPTGPAIPPSLAEPPSAPRVPESPAPLLREGSGDRSPAPPHASTPTGTPPHAPAGPGDGGPRATPPVGVSPEPRAPAADLPSSGQSSAPTPSRSSIPSTSAGSPPAVTTHAPEPAPTAAHGPPSATGASPSTHADSPGPSAAAANSPEVASPESPERSAANHADEWTFSRDDHGADPSSDGRADVTALEPTFDITTDHARQLGSDPDIGGAFRQSEAETGLRVEWEQDISLVRAPAGISGDWIDPISGRSYDAVGNFPAKYFDGQWPNLQTQIIDHLNKADYVPVDVSKFSAEQRQLVREFVEGLGTERAFIVGEGNGG